jgi:hypothetical protein
MTSRLKVEEFDDFVTTEQTELPEVVSIEDGFSIIVWRHLWTTFHQESKESLIDDFDLDYC